MAFNIECFLKNCFETAPLSLCISDYLQAGALVCAPSDSVLCFHQQRILGSLIVRCDKHRLRRKMEAVLVSTMLAH